jgi:hypothetical protein
MDVTHSLKAFMRWVSHSLEASDTSFSSTSTMSPSPTNAKASIPNQKKGGTTMQPLKSSSHSDWLSHCIHIAKILKEAADLIPVSYVKGAIGTVVILLETVEVCRQDFSRNTYLTWSNRKSNRIERICGSYVKIQRELWFTLASSWHLSRTLLA